LALMIASRDAGVASSGSSDWRSRSPAVASIASCMPPMKASSSNRYGSSCCVRSKRASGVATSRVPTSNGRATAGWMPRAISLKVPTVSEYPSSSPRTRAIVAPLAIGRELSKITSTPAGRPARQSSA
jgi:hypothetical protein